MLLFPNLTGKTLATAALCARPKPGTDKRRILDKCLNLLFYQQLDPIAPAS